MPQIDYVWSGGRLTELIAERFDAIVSSHNIEHQPCLISHLADLSGLLKPGGAVFLVVPDRRYCFDHFLPPTGIDQVLGAWFDGAERHRGEAVARHWHFLTHNDPIRHWRGDHGEDPYAHLKGREAGAYLRQIREAHLASNAYVDVHAWQFDPEGFRALLARLHDCGLSELMPARVYPTTLGGVEFFAILQPG